MFDPSDGSQPSQRTPIELRGQRLVDQLRNGNRTLEPLGSTTRDPRIGMALGGGSARGLTHIPYIEAMDEMGLVPSVLAGTSIGALIGSGWASGMSGVELREFALATMGTMRIFAGRIIAKHVGGIANFFQSGLSVQLDALKMYDAFTPDDHVKTFKELKFPFYVVATDFQSWHQVVFETGSLREAVAASIAIPTLFKPVVYANHILVDGSVVNPLPLDHAATNSDILIGIDVNGDPSEAIKRTQHKPLDMWFGSAQIMMHQMTAHMMAAYPPDIYMRPHVCTFGSLEFWRVKEIIENAAKDKEHFKRLVTAKIEAFIATQQRMRAAAPPSVLRQVPK